VRRGRHDAARMLLRRHCLHASSGNLQPTAGALYLTCSTSNL
jgi:hypothetical protein